MIAVWQKILAGFTASFLVIRDATVVNLSNNLTVSNVRIVFTFKRRFSRLCKIRKKTRNQALLLILSILYLRFICDFSFDRRIRHYIMAGGGLTN